MNHVRKSGNIKRKIATKHLRILKSNWGWLNRVHLLTEYFQMPFRPAAITSSIAPIIPHSQDQKRGQEPEPNVFRPCLQSGEIDATGRMLVFQAKGFHAAGLVHQWAR